jgi:rubrerythrin
MKVFEVLGLAQTIEENGANFYRQAATLHPDTRESEILLRLAGTEEEHKKVFAAMQEGLPNEQESDEQFLASIDQFLKAVSDSSDLEGSIFSAYLFSGEESLSDIVLIGIDLEKETILYYLGLKDLFRDEKDKKTIDTIIREEKDHLVTLAEEYKKLKAAEEE